MSIGVLGPLEVDGTVSSLGLRDRVVLEALSVRAGAPVSAEALAEALWGDSPPASGPKVVQGCIVRLRKALGTAAIETSPQGYRLVLHVDHLDHLHFEHLLKRARELLALGEPERATYLLGEAMGLWRGEPFSELVEWAPGRVEAERLLELRRDAEDLHTEAVLRCGRHEEALGPALRLVQEAPFRERRWGLLATAQYQAGRQHDALQTLQRARSVLVNELGLDPGPDLIYLEQAILRQDPSLVVEAALPESSPVCPYLGLVAYDISDAPAYFGREDDVAACLRRLDQAGVLAIVGPSGSGKSSLARAGVAAALERDGRRVRVITPGARPLAALEAAPPGRGSVLVVDQCEEALALDDGSPERTEFFAALVDFAASGQLILTLRADRLGEVAPHPGFAHLLERGLYLLAPMDGAGLRSAIEGPAEQAGLRLEPGLVDLLVREVEGEPGALPLLSHVLRQTWKRREGQTLTVAGYTATGGIREAVARSAERLFHEMSVAQQSMLRDLMLRLVAPDEAGDLVRTRVSRRSVAADDEHAAVVERLVGARLLSSDGDTVEIAHEALAVAWPRLRSWLDDDVEGLRVMRHLSVAAASWEELGRADSELYRGVRQARAAEWRQKHDPSLTPLEREFLDASSELAEQEQRATEEQVRRERRSNQRLRAGLAAVAVLLAVAIVTGALAVNSADRADQEAAVAAHQARAADARRLSAEALRSTEIDRALLLAAAGTTLDDSPDTRFALAQVLGRAPQLIGTARSGGSFISLSLRPDGATIAAAEPAGGLAIFDATTLEEIARNDDVPARGVRFSPDGRHLAVSVNPWSPTAERRVDPVPLRLLDPRTARLLPVQLGGIPRGRVLHETFAYSADGRWLAAGFIHPRYEDGKTFIRVWDTADPTRPAVSFTVDFQAHQLELIGDGSRIFAASDAGGHVFDRATGREVRPSATGPLGGLALNRDGSSLAMVDGSQIRLVDTEKLITTATLSEDGEINDPITFAPDGKQLAYLVDGTTVVRSLDDPDRPGVRYPTGDELPPSELAFGGSGTTLYAARTDGLLLAWDLEGDRRHVPASSVVEHDLAGDPFLSTMSPDGRTVAHFVNTGQGAWSVQFHDVRNGDLSRASPTGHTEGFYVNLAWRPDSQAVASVLDDEWVRLWDRESGRLIEEHRAPGDGVFSVAFSRDGSRLAIGTRNGWVKTIGGGGRTSGTDIRISTQKPVASLSVSDDGQRAVAIAGEEGVLLDLNSGRVLRRADLGFVVGGLTWAPDGQTLAASGFAASRAGAGATALLDAETLAKVWVVFGPQAGGEYPTYSPDGGRFMTVGHGQLSTGDPEGRVRIFDVHSGAVVGSLRSEDLAAAAFGAGTWTVILVSSTGGISRWDARPEAAFKAACRIVGRDLTAEEWRAYLPNREQEPVCPQ